jgi:hypothetical protein
MSRNKLCQMTYLHHSAVAIQSHWRRRVQQVSFWRTLFVVIKLQGISRGVAVRETIETQSLAARKIQARWRTFAWCVSRNNASQRIQRYWRGYHCQREFRISVAAAMCIQVAWRGYLVRDSIEKQHFAARILQSNWRCYWAKLNYNLDVLEIVIAQSVARRYLGEKEAFRRRQCVITIQNTFRRHQATVFLEHLQNERLESAILEGTVIAVQVCLFYCLLIRVLQFDVANRRCCSLSFEGVKLRSCEGVQYLLWSLSNPVGEECRPDPVSVPFNSLLSGCKPRIGERSRDCCTNVSLRWPRVYKVDGGASCSTSNTVCVLLT